MRAFRPILAIVGVLVIALAQIFIMALRVPSPLPAPARSFTLERVILTEPGQPQRGPVRVVVRDGLIASIESVIAIEQAEAEPPEFVDAYVLPGFTDSHAHFPTLGLPGDAEFTSLLMLRHGVTRVRLVGGVDPSDLTRYRIRIRDGDAPGPLYFGCGPFIDGEDPILPGAHVVTNRQEARRAVFALADQGVDCIKAYEMLNRESAIALREAAHERGLPVVGHTPRFVSFEDARFDDHQHLRGVHPPFENERLEYPHFLRAWLRHGPERMAEVIRISLEYGIAHTPTLSAVDATLQAEDWAAWQRGNIMQQWLPHARDGFWSADVGFNPVRFMGSDDFALIRQASKRQRETVKAFFDAGVPIHTGTDSNAPNLVPGASLHRELRLLVEAGLTPDQALEASTKTSARFLGIPNAGQLRVGAPADLLVFKENPTADLDALDTLVAVAAAGRFYRTNEIEDRLDRYREHYDGFAFNRGLMPILRTTLDLSTSLMDRPAH